MGCNNRGFAFDAALPCVLFFLSFFSCSVGLLGAARVADSMCTSVAEARRQLGDFSKLFKGACEFKDRVQRDCARTEMTVSKKYHTQVCPPTVSREQRTGVYFIFCRMLPLSTVMNPRRLSLPRSLPRFIGLK